MARVFDPLIAEAARDVLARGPDRLLEQVIVAGRPEPEGRRGDRRERAARGELALRQQVRAIPVQAGGQRARPRQILDVTSDVAVAASPFTQELPVVAPEPGARYPKVLDRIGTAPPQYTYDDADS